MSHGLDRRALLAAAGLTLIVPTLSGAALVRKVLTLELVTRELSPQPGRPATSTWRFADDTAPRFAQGDEIDVTIVNRLPVRVLISWRGLDGSPALEPLLARGPIAAGGSEFYALKLRHAGTLLCDARLLHDSVSQPLPMLPLVVTETTAPSVDRDEVLLVEDQRLRSGGDAAAGAEPTYQVNGHSTFRIEARPQDRLRLRFINGTQSPVIALQLSGVDVRVIAIDGQPSEPFLARSGRLVLACGTRIDALVDATGPSHDITLDDGVRSTKIGEIVTSGEPRRATALPPAALPSNGLPEKLPLQSALRVDLALSASSEWTAPAAMTAASVPAFRVKRSRAVVLALTNPAETAVVFRLHGHHMRLLDRLDDGWKPFWLDTIAVPAKQTIRTAFGATHSGAYLMEIDSAAWGGARLLKSYIVED